jgi:hypothetical protein
MQNNVGIYASQISGHLYNGPYGAYDSLATVTVPSGGVASVSFAGIPTGYKHLQLRYLVKGSANVDLNMTFNNSSSSYEVHILRGDGSSATASAYAITTVTNIGSGGFTAGVTDILDYTSTSKNKTSRTLVGADYNGSGTVGLWSHLWYATPVAITSITLTPASGTISEFSSFALYGVK